MRIGEIMNKGVIATTSDEDAEHAWAEMRLRSLRHLVVMQGKRVIGIVSDRDLGGRNGAATRKGRAVGELMTANVVSVDPDTTIRQAANLMRGRTIGCLPVLENGRVVGIVTITDILEQLGRGSTRPIVRAQRRVRRAPAGHHEIGGTTRSRAISRTSKVPKKRQAKSRLGSR